MFRHLYESPWHNPIPFLVFNGFVLALAPKRRGFLNVWLLVFSFEIMLDAMLTGSLSPLPRAHPAAAQWFAIAFVMAGDFRFFLLHERVLTLSDDRKSPASRYVSRALVWSFIVPLASTVWARLLPTVFSSGRRVALAYELGMLVVLGAFFVRRVRSIPPTSSVTAAIRRWLVRVLAFEACMYALWATADALLLAGTDVGYLLRLIPNVMYYAAFVPFCVLLAPAETRR